MTGGRVAWNVVTSLNNSEAENFGHEEHLGLEACGVCVGDVVRHHIHLLAQHHLSR